MKFQRSGNIGSKSAELVEGSDSIVTLAHSEGQHSSDDDCRSLVVRSALQTQQNHALLTSSACSIIWWMLWWHWNAYEKSQTDQTVKEYWIISQIQLVVYYQYCFLIGWATSRIYVIAH